MSEFAQSVVGHWALWDIRSLSDEFPFATHHCGGDRSRIILVAIFRRRLCLIRERPGPYGRKLHRREPEVWV